MRLLLLGILAANLLVATTASAAIVFNEFNPNPTGTETETSFFEFAGNPGETLTGLSLIAVDNDTGNANLVVNNVVPLTGSIGSNGLLAVTIEIENPSYTLVLSDNSNNLAEAQDLDPDDNGAIDDFSIFGNVSDAVSIFDSTNDTPNGFASSLGGTDLLYPTAPDPTDGDGPFFDTLPSNEPQIAFRDRLSGLWYQASEDFTLMADADGNPIDGSAFDIVGFTQGAANPTSVPEPGVSACLFAMGISGALRRRRN